jgi:hypothetical protein
MKLFAAILENYAPRADRSIKIIFATGEATPKDAAFLQESLHKFFFLALSEQPFTDSEKVEVEALKADYNDTGKTHSQRLRGVLYRGWEQDNLGYSDFHDYYMIKMDKIINHFKDKLL